MMLFFLTCFKLSLGKQKPSPFHSCQDNCSPSPESKMLADYSLFVLKYPCQVLLKSRSKNVHSHRRRLQARQAFVWECKGKRPRCCCNYQPEETITVFTQQKNVKTKAPFSSRNTDGVLIVTAILSANTSCWLKWKITTAGDQVPLPLQSTHSTLSRAVCVRAGVLETQMDKVRWFGLDLLIWWWWCGAHLQWFPNFFQFHLN